MKKKRQRRLQSKLQISILITVFIVFSLSILFVAIRMRSGSIEDAKTIVNTTARENANLVASILDRDLNICRTFGQTLLGYMERRGDRLIALSSNMLEGLLMKNQDVYSTWVSFDLRAIDSTWDKSYGRRRLAFVKKNNMIISQDDIIELDGENKKGLYYQLKIEKKEKIAEPYFFTYDGNNENDILETFISVPLLIDNTFVGLAGVDVTLGSCLSIVDSIKPFQESNAILLSNSGIIVACNNKSYVGKLFSEYDELNNIRHNVIDKVSKGETFSYETQIEGRSYYVSHVPVIVGESAALWSLQISVPLDLILTKSTGNIRWAIVIGVLGMIILSIIVWYITHSIIMPIRRTTQTLTLIAQGNITDVETLKVNTGDEIESMSDSVNILIESLKQTANFAKEIGQGKLDAQYKFLSKNDEIGKALFEMQKSLLKSSEEEQLRRMEEDKQHWISSGLAYFGDILRKTVVDEEKMSFNVISNLVKYIDVQQGCIYTVNDTAQDASDDETYFELKAAVAFDRRKLISHRVYKGEGLVGRCAHEKFTIYMTDVPEGYVYINSGLGEAKPGSVLLVPLMLNDHVFGIIELVSFKQIEQHKIIFVEKVAESIAVTLANVMINKKTEVLLKESQKQREDLAAQEEAMRQNIEELQAMQEEASRREAELKSIRKVFNHVALIVEYDTNFNVVAVNEKSKHFFGQPAENLESTSHQSLGFIEDNDNVIYTAFIQKIKSGQIMQRQSTLVKRGQSIKLQETYAPLYNQDGIITGFVSVAIDITPTA